MANKELEIIQRQKLKVTDIHWSLYVVNYASGKKLYKVNTLTTTKDGIFVYNGTTVTFEQRIRAFITITLNDGTVQEVTPAYNSPILMTYFNTKWSNVSLMLSTFKTGAIELENSFIKFAENGDLTCDKNTSLDSRQTRLALLQLKDKAQLIDPIVITQAGENSINTYYLPKYDIQFGPTYYGLLLGYSSAFPTDIPEEEKSKYPSANEDLVKFGESQTTLAVYEFDYIYLFIKQQTKTDVKYYTEKCQVTKVELAKETSNLDSSQVDDFFSIDGDKGITVPDSYIDGTISNNLDPKYVYSPCYLALNLTMKSDKFGLIKSSQCINYSYQNNMLIRFSWVNREDYHKYPVIANSPTDSDINIIPNGSVANLYSLTLGFDKVAKPYIKYTLKSEDTFMDSGDWWNNCCSIKDISITAYLKYNYVKNLEIGHFMPSITYESATVNSVTYLYRDKGSSYGSYRTSSTGKEIISCIVVDPPREANTTNLYLAQPNLRINISPIDNIELRNSSFLILSSMSMIVLCVKGFFNDSKCVLTKELDKSISTQKIEREDKQYLLSSNFYRIFVYSNGNLPDWGDNILDPITHSTMLRCITNQDTGLFEPIKVGDTVSYLSYLNPSSDEYKYPVAKRGALKPPLTINKYDNYRYIKLQLA